MSSSVISSFNFALQQVAIYSNIVNLVAGISGGILNIIVFLSLKTFRDNTCAFYLVVMSFFNIGQLLTGSLSRLIISGFNIDWTISSLAYCKIRIYTFQMSSLISLTCLCLATIDQYFATCSRPRWQRWSNIKLVRYLSAATIIFWSFFAILYAVYYNIMVSPTTGKITCMSSNDVFDQYNTYFHRIIMQGFLPNLITALFGLLAHFNTKHLAYRTVPLVRRDLDNQLTTMLLVQIVFNIFALSLFNIISVIIPFVLTTKDPVVIAKIQFVQILSYGLYYTYFACPFYIYVCVSERFRRQLAYVLFVKHFECCQKPKLGTNEVAPQA